MEENDPVVQQRVLMVKMQECNEMTKKIMKECEMEISMDDVAEQSSSESSESSGSSVSSIQSEEEEKPELDTIQKTQE